MNDLKKKVLLSNSLTRPKTIIIFQCDILNYTDLSDCIVHAGDPSISDLYRHTNAKVPRHNKYSICYQFSQNVMRYIFQQFLILVVIPKRCTLFGEQNWTSIKSKR